jgi:carbonic anhydrase
MMFEIGSVQRFIVSEVMRLRARYPKICVAPMLYKVEDNRLYFLEDNSS